MATEQRKPEVLVIDDEIQIRRLLRITLESGGFAVRDCECGLVGLSEIAFRRPDVIVLDIGLPDISGVEVLKRLREWTKVPVLILSVLGHEDDKVAARLRVMLRHARPDDGISIVRFGSIEIDFASRIVSKRGEEVPLTAKEYGLLKLLVSHRGRVLTHRQVLRDVWGPSAEDRTHYLRVYMDRLRRKLEDDPKQPEYFKTVLGVGYRFVGE
jgi:two-component system KDP operon response regulator KdpE